jgi:hypothetical protein
MTTRMLALVCLTFPVVTAPVSADVLELNAGYVQNTFSFVTIPTFNPSLGTLESFIYEVTFYGAVATETGCPDCQFSYQGTVSPFLLLASPVDLFAYGNFALSGTATTDDSGLGVVPFSGRASIDSSIPDNGLIGPPTTISVGAHFYAFSSIEPGQWFLDYDLANVTVQYDYTPVPEPSMLGLIASILLAIVLAGWRSNWSLVGRRGR